MSPAGPPGVTPTPREGSLCGLHLAWGSPPRMGSPRMEPLHWRLETAGPAAAPGPQQQRRGVLRGSRALVRASKAPSGADVTQLGAP